ncbi:MAG: hypothetical protein E6J26_04505 [Chloroflexi bacterium]|nr:MAG: hypothetical protein E6J26_04505 [Chloroflexota bacterium]
MNHRCISRSEWRWLAVVTALIVLLSVAPNAWGDLIASPAYHFSGVVFLPEDGDTYVAKIRQGMQGAWLYSMVFNADPGPPLLLYTYYLLWGHIGALLNWEAEFIFLVARILAAVVLLISLYVFVARFFYRARERRFAFLLAAVGGGFGWLTLLAGHPTPDIVQPEMFPFASILANAHFALAMAATLCLLDLIVRVPPERVQDVSRSTWLLILLASVFLASSAPPPLAVVALVGGLWLGARWYSTRALPRATFAQLAGVLLLAAPFALYYGWQSVSNSAYAAWNRQNTTPSFPPLDYALAGGSVLLLAGLYLWREFRRNSLECIRNSDDFMLVVWVLVVAAVSYLPFIALQRRFSVAAFVPLAVLAAKAVFTSARLNTMVVRVGLLTMAALTNAVLLLVLFVGLFLHAPTLFLSADEWQAVRFLRASADRQALVLSSPQMGLFLPVWSGQRVVFGHPVETFDAKARRVQVEQFYAGLLDDPQSFLAPVDYIFVGPRERGLGAPAIPSSFRLSFANGDVTVYAKQR